jgi:hypothetical protein
MLTVHAKCREWLQLWHYLEWYHRDGGAFLSHIVQVTGDETWVTFVNVDTREQSKQWMHTHSPKKLKKFELRCFKKGFILCIYNVLQIRAACPASRFLLYFQTNSG